MKTGAELNRKPSAPVSYQESIIKTLQSSSRTKTSGPDDNQAGDSDAKCVRHLMENIAQAAGSYNVSMPEWDQRLTEKSSILLDSVVKDVSFSERRKKASQRSASAVRRASAKAQRQRQLFKLDKSSQTFASYAPLHDLWKRYFLELLPERVDYRNVNLQNSLAKADYHGAVVRVLKSRCPSYVGAQGMLLQETRNVLKLVTTDNKLKLIPKAHSMFGILLPPDWSSMLTLHGNQITMRSSERSAKKFKSKNTLVL